MACAVKAETDLKRAQETVAGPDFQQRIFTGRVLSLTEEFLSIRIVRANLNTGLDDMTPLVSRMNDDVKKPLSSVSTEVSEDVRVHGRGHQPEISRSLR